MFDSFLSFLKFLTSNPARRFSKSIMSLAAALMHSLLVVHLHPVRWTCFGVKVLDGLEYGVGLAAAVQDPTLFLFSGLATTTFVLLPSCMG
jgi:hypothetical protein